MDISGTQMSIDGVFFCGIIRCAKMLYEPEKSGNVMANFGNVWQSML